MGKWLNGSAKTGEKIIKNLNLFKFEFSKSENGMVTFLWSFDGQHGYVNIHVDNNKVSISSLIDTDKSSPHKFDRPLALYNDSTLLKVFEIMMQSTN